MTGRPRIPGHLSGIARLENVGDVDFPTGAPDGSLLERKDDRWKATGFLGTQVVVAYDTTVDGFYGAACGDNAVVVGVPSGGVDGITCAASQALFRKDTGDLNFFSLDDLYKEIMKSRRGTSFPSSPNDGDEFYRTDTDNPEWFYWDASRSRWLGRAIMKAHLSNNSPNGAETATINAFYGSGSRNFPTTKDTVAGVHKGWLVPYDCTIIGWSIVVTPASSQTYELKHRDHSATTTSTVSSKTMSSENRFIEMDLNIDVEAEDQMFTRMIGGTPGATNFEIYARRRMS